MLQFHPPVSRPDTRLLLMMGSPLAPLSPAPHLPPGNPWHQVLPGTPQAQSPPSLSVFSLFPGAAAMALSSGCHCSLTWHHRRGRPGGLLPVQREVEANAVSFLRMNTGTYLVFTCQNRTIPGSPEDSEGPSQASAPCH